MDEHRRAEIVKELARETGFDLCGIAPAAPIPRETYLRQWLARGRAGTMGYLHRHVDSRIDVRTWLPATKSVIVCGLNYHQPEPQRPSDAEHRGRVAMYAWGDDYHRVMREKLGALADRLRERFGESIQLRPCVDTSAIVERELAASAGIGWIGKNTMVLNARIGSYFFLGELLTDLALAPDAPQPDHCGSCRRCLDACPTDAFPQPYEMDASRCISYLTIEHRGEIDGELARGTGDWVFGCDVCQQVCPFNCDAPFGSEPRLAGTAEDAYPPLAVIESWDEVAYRRATRSRAQSRAKLGMWRRNAAVAEANLSQLG